MTTSLEAKLGEFARRLVDQNAARVIVPADVPGSGSWFGGGNLCEHEGRLYLVGRFRNPGDSREGLSVGERGFALVVFVSDDRGATFTEVTRFCKSDLDISDHQVLSIEGSALNWTRDGIELFVSTEKKNLAYPADLAAYQKPGTGVWTVDYLHASSIEGLKQATREILLTSADARWMHMKDPFLFRCSAGETVLFFCTHPYCWTSSNTALTIRPSDASSFGNVDASFFPRGFAWDVAMTRGTCVLDVPQVGPFAERQVQLMFYDGGESVRNLDEHLAAVKRPRGYSCEELGGVAYCQNEDWHGITRLSQNCPWFVSPHGTGCSRYVDVLRTDDGYYATWQQSQADGSQPLVMNHLARDEAERLLS